MQAMLRLYMEWAPCCDTSLRTVFLAGSAPDTGVTDPIALWLSHCAADLIDLTEDGVYPKIKILNSKALQLKNDADISGLIGIDIRKVRLLAEYRIDFSACSVSTAMIALPESRIISLKRV